MESMDLYAVLGVMAVAIIIALAFRVYNRKDGKPKYDERQQAARTRSYMLGYWVLIAYILLNGLYTQVTDKMWADVMTTSFIGVCISVAVFVVACIFKDAYFAVNQRPRFYFALFGFIGAVDIIVTVKNIMDGEEFFTGGILNFHAMTPTVVVLMLTVLIAMGIKQAVSKKED